MRIPSDINYKKIEREHINLSNSTIIAGDSYIALQKLPDESVQCAVTSPPYWGLRDYGIEGQIGLEDKLQKYINNLLVIFREVKRVLSSDGVLWLNIGDGYTSGNRGYRAPDKKNPARAMNIRPDTPAGLKPKDLLGVPWRLAFALQEDGWYLRSDIIWNKPNAMPESVKDRPTRAHEYLLDLFDNPVGCLTGHAKYSVFCYFSAEVVRNLKVIEQLYLCLQRVKNIFMTIKR